MIDHLTGDHPEFWDPEKLLRVRRDTGLIEAAVTATIRLPVVNSGFLDFGNRVAFTATARATVADATGGALVEVEHSGQFIDEAEPWNGRTTVRGGLSDDQWVDLAVVFDTELAVNGRVVSRTRVPVHDPFVPVGPLVDRGAVTTTEQDTGWFLVRLLERCSDDLGLVDDSEVTVRWGDLRGLHRKDSGTGLQLPPLDMD